MVGYFSNHRRQLVVNKFLLETIFLALIHLRIRETSWTMWSGYNSEQFCGTTLHKTWESLLWNNINIKSGANLYIYKDPMVRYSPLSESSDRFRACLWSCVAWTGSGLWGVCRACNRTRTNRRSNRKPSLCSAPLAPCIRGCPWKLPKIANRWIEIRNIAIVNMRSKNVSVKTCEAKVALHACVRFLLGEITCKAKIWYPNMSMLVEKYVGRL